MTLFLHIINKGGGGPCLPEETGHYEKKDGIDDFIIDFISSITE